MQEIRNFIISVQSILRKTRVKGGWWSIKNATVKKCTTIMASCSLLADRSTDC
jgi:hypothetical protein